MSFELTPKSAQKIFEGDGGEYYSWSSSEFPLLGDVKVGAGKLVLHPQGFALPHYADSSKLGYVLQGSDGLVGMIYPNTSEEVVLKIGKGDVILVPLGTTSWWFNNGDSDLIVVFLGETSKSYVHGEFNYFFLAGTQSILGGFSTEFLSRAYDLNKDEANKLVKSQTGVLIIKLQKGKNMPKPNKDNNNKRVYNIDVSLPDVEVENAGLTTTLTEEKFPFIGESGLSANLLKLGPKALCSPIYRSDSSIEVIYVVKGSGQIQIVGLNGKRVLDVEVKPGQLIVVPRFFVVAKLAGGDGLECFSILTTKQPVLEELAGKAAVWEAFSPEVVEASLDVSSEFVKLFKSKIKKTTILVPPTD